MQMRVLCWNIEVAVLVCVVATVSVVESHARGPRAGGILVRDHAWA